MKLWLKKLYISITGAYLNLLVLIWPAAAARRAFEIFCKVRKGRVLPKQAAYLDAARDQRLNASGFEIQTYLWPGKGPTLLLIHGWESNSFRWRNLISFLREADFNIVAFDAPGHGHSEGNYLHVPLYTQCVDVVVNHYKPIYLVGHSVGGMTAIYYEHKHENKEIEKMVTIGSPSEFQKILLQYKQTLKLSDRVIRALDALIYSHFGFYAAELTTHNFVKSNTKKGMVVHDKEDRIVPHIDSVNVHRAWENSIMISTEGLGHSMHQEAVNLKIREFLLSS